MTMHPGVTIRRGVTMCPAGMRRGVMRRDVLGRPGVVRRPAPIVFLVIAIALAAVGTGTADIPVRTASLPPVDKSLLDFSDPEPLTRPLDGVAQLVALRDAYPDRIQRMEYRNGDWAILVNGEWIYWANGRMLPRKARHHWYEFNRFPFYPYRDGPLVVPDLSDREEQRLRTVLARMNEQPPQRHGAFPGTLYGVRTAGQAREKMVTVTLMGHRIRVHPMIREPLRRVQEEIDVLLRDDPEVQAFNLDLLRVEGFLWRSIAGTQTVSNHGYGIAVDLVPRSYFRRNAYWRWSEQAGIEEWWNIPVERRWTVPRVIVEAFERHGFVWGGRWLFFDAIHFEYRPELFLLEDLPDHEDVPDLS